MTAADQTGLCRGVLDVVSLLSPAGVPRPLLYAAGEAGVLPRPAWSGRPGRGRVMRRWGCWRSASLLAFSGDDSP